MSRQYGQREPEFTPGSLKSRRDKEPEPKEKDPTPPEEVVRKFHQNASVDKRPTDIHHTLGPEENQAAGGKHSHDGGDSVKLLEGMTLVGNKTIAEQVIPSIIACLVRLGAQDSTT